MRQILRELADAEKRVEALRWELRRLVELAKELGGAQHTLDSLPWYGL